MKREATVIALEGLRDFRMKIQYCITTQALPFWDGLA